MPRPVELLALWLLFINLLGFFLFGLDKHKAVRRRWRIPEAMLFLTALAGGSPGCIAGMCLFRHKTKPVQFRLGLPLILVTHLLLALYLLKKGGLF